MIATTDGYSHIGTDKRDMIIRSWIRAARLHLKRARGLRIILSDGKDTGVACRKCVSTRTLGQS
jgi:hypothetical protein